MLIKQYVFYSGVHGLVTIKGHSQMCYFITQSNGSNFTSFDGLAIGVLHAGESTRAVFSELNFHFETTSCLHHYLNSNLAVHPTSLTTAVPL
jgi:hypothetical protein